MISELEELFGGEDAWDFFPQDPVSPPISSAFENLKRDEGKRLNIKSDPQLESGDICRSCGATQNLEDETAAALWLCGRCGHTNETWLAQESEAALASAFSHTHTFTPSHTHTHSHTHTLPHTHTLEHGEGGRNRGGAERERGGHQVYLQRCLRLYRREVPCVLAKLPQPPPTERVLASVAAHFARTSQSMSARRVRKTAVAVAFVVAKGDGHGPVFEEYRRLFGGPRSRLLRFLRELTASSFDRSKKEGLLALKESEGTAGAGEHAERTTFSNESRAEKEKEKEIENEIVTKADLEAKFKTQAQSEWQDVSLAKISALPFREVRGTAEGTEAIIGSAVPRFYDQLLREWEHGVEDGRARGRGRSISKRALQDKSPKPLPIGDEPSIAVELESLGGGHESLGGSELPDDEWSRLFGPDLVTGTYVPEFAASRSCPDQNNLNAVENVNHEAPAPSPSLQDLLSSASSFDTSFDTSSVTDNDNDIDNDLTPLLAIDAIKSDAGSKGSTSSSGMTSNYNSNLSTNQLYPSQTWVHTQRRRELVKQWAEIAVKMAAALNLTLDAEASSKRPVHLASLLLLSGRLLLPNAFAGPGSKPRRRDEGERASSTEPRISVAAAARFARISTVYVTKTAGALTQQLLDFAAKKGFPLTFLKAITRGERAAGSGRLAYVFLKFFGPDTANKPDTLDRYIT